MDRTGADFVLRLTPSTEKELLSETAYEFLPLPPEQALLVILSDVEIARDAHNRADQLQLTENDDFLFAVKSLGKYIEDSQIEGKSYISRLVEETSRVSGERAREKLFYAVEFLFRKDYKLVASQIRSLLEVDDKHIRLGTCRTLLYVLNAMRCEGEMEREVKAREKKPKVLIEVLSELKLNLPDGQAEKSRLSKTSHLVQEWLSVRSDSIHDVLKCADTNRATLLNMTAADCTILLCGWALENLSEMSDEIRRAEKDLYSSCVKEIQSALKFVTWVESRWFIVERPLYSAILSKLNRERTLCSLNDESNDVFSMWSRISFLMVQTASEDVNRDIIRCVKYLKDQLVPSSEPQKEEESRETCSEICAQLVELGMLIGKLNPEASESHISAHIVELYEVAGLALLRGRERLIAKIGGALWNHIKTLASNSLIEAMKDTWINFLSKNSLEDRAGAIEIKSALLDTYADQQVALLETLYAFLLSSNQDQVSNALSIFQYILINEHANVVSWREPCIRKVVSLIASSGLNAETQKILNWIKKKEWIDLLQVELNRLLTEEEASKFILAVFSHPTKGKDTMLYILRKLLEMNDMENTKNDRVDLKKVFFELLKTWSTQRFRIDYAAYPPPAKTWESVIIEAESYLFEHTKDTFWIEFFSVLSPVFSCFLSMCYFIILYRINARKSEFECVEAFDQIPTEEVRESLLSNQLPSYLILQTLNIHSEQLGDTDSIPALEDEITRRLLKSVISTQEHSIIRLLASNLLSRYSPSKFTQLVFRPIDAYIRSAHKPPTCDEMHWNCLTASIHYFHTLMSNNVTLDAKLHSDLVSAIFDIFNNKEHALIRRKLQDLKKQSLDLLVLMMMNQEAAIDHSLRDAPLAPRHVFNLCMDRFLHWCPKTEFCNWIEHTIKTFIDEVKKKEQHLPIINIVFTIFIRETTKGVKSRAKHRIKLICMAVHANLTLGENAEFISKWADVLFKRACFFSVHSDPMFALSGLELLGSLMFNAVNQLFTKLSCVAKATSTLSRVSTESSNDVCKDVASRLLAQFSIFYM